MDHNNPQKTLARFILSEGGGQWLASQGSGPVVPVVLALVLLADDHNVVECKQADLAGAVGFGLSTIKRAFKSLHDLGIIRSVRRGVYVLASYESLKVKCHSETLGAEKSQSETRKALKCQSETFDGEKEAIQPGLSSYNKLLLRSSSPRPPARASSIAEKQEIILRVEEIVARNISPHAWAQSTSWHELIDRADWNLEIISDALVAYADKVIGSGQPHQFSRLYNFVVREVEGRRKREMMAVQSRPNYNPPNLDTGGEKITGEEMKELQRFLNV
jgi:hypothetical protein